MSSIALSEGATSLVLTLAVVTMEVDGKAGDREVVHGSVPFCVVILCVAHTRFAGGWCCGLWVGRLRATHEK